MSILDELSYDEGRVVDFTLSKDKKVVAVEEACDMYFKVDLNKRRFGVLIEELKQIHDQMEGS